jgi:hypothetical protein
MEVFCAVRAVLRQARAQVESAKQQLVLLEAEADGARIRGQAEAQAAEVGGLGGWLHAPGLGSRQTDLWSAYIPAFRGRRAHLTYRVCCVHGSGCSLKTCNANCASFKCVDAYQCLQAARGSVVREAAALEEQRAALASLLAQLEQREEGLGQVGTQSGTQVAK